MNKYKLNFFAIFIWGAIVLVAIGMFVSMAYDAFYIPPDKDELSIMKVELKYVGTCTHRKGGQNYIPATIEKNGNVEWIKLPCDQQVSMLGNERGKQIEIGFDPHHLSFLSRQINVWYIFSKDNVYFEYFEAIAKHQKNKQHHKNIVYLLALYTAFLIAKNCSGITKNFVAQNSRNGLEIIKEKNKITYMPSNTLNRTFIYGAAYPVILCTYAGLFMHPIFLVVSIPLIISMVLVHRSIKKNTHGITISMDGIKYDLLNDSEIRHILKWSEIDDVTTMGGRWGELVLLIKLKDSDRTSLLTKIGNLSYDLNIALSQFENSYELRETILDTFSFFKAKDQIIT